MPSATLLLVPQLDPVQPGMWLLVLTHRRKVLKRALFLRVRKSRMPSPTVWLANLALSST